MQLWSGPSWEKSQPKSWHKMYIWRLSKPLSEMIMESSRGPGWNIVWGERGYKRREAQRKDESCILNLKFLRKTTWQCPVDGQHCGSSLLQSSGYNMNLGAAPLGLGILHDTSKMTPWGGSLGENSYLKERKQQELTERSVSHLNACATPPAPVVFQPSHWTFCFLICDHTDHY